MPSSGAFNTTSYNNRYLTFSWNVESQNIAQNTTTIDWTLIGAGEGLNYPADNFKVIINGATVYTSNTPIDLYNGTVVKSGSYTITHNSDGTKSFTAGVTAEINDNAVVGSDTFELPAISRASIIERVNGNKITDNFSVNIFKYNAAFTNTLQIALNGVVLQSLANYDNSIFTLSNALKTAIYNATASSKYVTLDFSVKTYYGSVVIGTSESVEVTIEINDSNPVLGSVTYLDSNAATVLITGDNQKIIRNKSLLQITAAGLTAQNGATLASLSINIAGQTETTVNPGSTESISFGAVNLATDGVLTATLIDTRGNKTVSKITVSVYDWTAPTAIISLNRQNNVLTATDLTVNSRVASLGGLNTTTIKAYTKQAAAQDYGTAIDITDGALTTLTLDNTKAWNVKVTITDKLATTTYILYVAKGQPIVFIDEVLGSVGVNCFPVNQNSIEINGKDILKSLYYFTGDQYSAQKRETSGYLSDGNIVFTVTLPKSAAGVTPTITDLKVNVRHVGGGYIFPYSASGYDVLDAGLTVSTYKQDDYLTVTISGTYSATNNTPLSVMLESMAVSFQ